MHDTLRRGSGLLLACRSICTPNGGGSCKSTLYLGLACALCPVRECASLSDSLATTILSVDRPRVPSCETTPLLTFPHGILHESAEKAVIPSGNPSLGRVRVFTWDSKRERGPVPWAVPVILTLWSILVTLCPGPALEATGPYFYSVRLSIFASC